MTPTTLREIRTTLGLTKVQFASLIGVTRRALDLWEAGDRGIPEPVARLVLLAQARKGVRAALQRMSEARPEPTPCDAT